MAEVKISALTAATELTDDDVLVVNDGATTKKITAANARGGMSPYPAMALDRTNLTTGLYRSLWWCRGGAATSTGILDGWVVGCLQYCPAQTPGSVSLYVDTGQTSSTTYVGLYEIDATSGLPGVKHVSWAIDTSAAGISTLTGQSAAVTAGWYWVMFTRIGGTGTVSLASHSYLYGANVTPITDNGSGNNSAMIVETGLSAESSDLSAATWASNGNGIPKVWVEE